MAEGVNMVEQVLGYLTSFGVDATSTGVKEFLYTASGSKNIMIRKMFGQELILERPVSIESGKSVNENIADSVRMELLAFSSSLTDKLMERVSAEKYKIEELIGYILFYPLLMPENLTAGRIEKVGPVLERWVNWEVELVDKPSHAEFSLCDNGNTLYSYKIPYGIKWCRYINRLGKEFGLEEKASDVINAYSMAKGERALQGTLCLSIHPMDYLTMSDNAHGWSSCHSVEDYGCHVAGTFELATSRCVIMAYLKSDKVSYCDWNSKKWRQGFIVDDDIVVGMKSYPFMSDKLSEIAINWIVELLNEKTDFHYDTPFNLRTGEKLDLKVYFSTLYSWNETAGKRKLGWMSKRKGEKDTRINIDLEGDVHCLYCGTRRNKWDRGLFEESGLEDYIGTHTLYCKDCEEREYGR